MESGHETRVTSFKVLMMSTGLLSIIVALKVSLPVMADFMMYEAPMLWSYLVSCFRPPYLYLLINTIIFTIVASSKLQTSSNEFESPSYGLSAPAARIRGSEQEFAEAKPGFEFGCPMTIGPAEDGETETGDAEAGVSDAAEDEFVISRSSWMPPVKGSTFADKPPASSRFSSRRSPKPTPEGVRGLGVSKPKRGETLESTWRTITDGRAMPLARHLRKSDTFTKGTTELETGDSPSIKLMQKSETFGCNKEGNLNSPGKLRREASLSHDELNKRVEAFINKFNEEMRLQRQESLNHYHRMVQR